jgi:hypothetical protein
VFKQTEEKKDLDKAFRKKKTSFNYVQIEAYVNQAPEWKCNHVKKCPTDFICLRKQR